MIPRQARLGTPPRLVWRNVWDETVFDLEKCAVFDYACHQNMIFVIRRF
jgi:hypothetical protein